MINGCLLNLVMASRLMYGMANEKVVPDVLGKVQPGRRTPWVAIIFTASIAAVLVCLGDLETLADTTVLLLLFVFIGVNVSLLVLRRTPAEHEHFRRLDHPAVPRRADLRGPGGPVDGRRSEARPVGRRAIVFGLILWVIERAVR